ncbi:SpoIIE family protein phosphatase [Streptomyces sp. SHP 1-2]|uniref:SpoIIE family protein phosphatase n=1 Tax=Streptomyces sp. SHP 1-2 TaxID=2769489 RepID=UPI002237C426|nr:SpoIIE family protein phosphatase [Streptomyces sp. SHP 1-2]MCW5250317.1 serine/threonine-protein phosphatase [Streptomyces sp. SHP 1-2]
MADPGTSASSRPDEWPDWPARPSPVLALNRMGSFDWDLDTGLIHLDARAHEVLDLLPEEFDGRPEALAGRVPRAESLRLDTLVAQAMRNGSEHYGAYFRVRLRDGTLRWAHTQGRIRRDATGRPHRVIGILRDATPELEESDARRDRAALDEARRRRTGVVQSATAALAHARTVDDVIDALKDTAGLPHLGATGVVMGLVEGDRIVLVAEGPDDGYADEGARVTRIDEAYPMSEAVRTLSPRFIESPREFAERYPALWPHLTGLRITAAAYLPLIAQARPIGAVGLLYSDRSGFTPEDRDVLVAVGSSIAQSLQRAMLYEQRTDLAEGLQQAMLPRTIPSVPGCDIAVCYRAASAAGTLGRDIGGDWYDLIPLPGGRVGAVIGDVQGHDTHAAAVMGQLRIVLRAYAAEGHPPATVMARASVFLHELDTDRFATCLYAEADLATGVIQAVRAGHIDPLLRHGGGACRRAPVPGGLPLGLSAEFGQLSYPVGTIELDPGDTLVLCTDGLVERPGADLDDGVRALAALVASGPEEVRALADRLIELAGRRRGDDDAALLLLRRRERESQGAGRRLRRHVAPGDPAALGGARRTIRTAARVWGLGRHADDIALVADELITNVLLHTEGFAVVTLRLLSDTARRLRVEVEDSSSALPRRREAGENGMTGRGLLLVETLADGWGVEARGGGKCVWAEFALPGPAAAPAEEPARAVRPAAPEPPGRES